MKKFKINKERYLLFIFGVISAFFSFFAGYFIHQKISPFDAIFTFYAIIHCAWFVLLCRCDLDKMQTVINFYFVFIFVAFAPIVIMTLKESNLRAFLWYLMIPIASLTLGLKQMLKWCIATLVLIAALIFITPHVNLSVQISDNQQHILDTMCIFIAIILAIFLIFYSIIFNNIVEYVKNNKENNVNFSTLYADILNFFDKNKPYLNPDFDIALLSADLNVNQNYIRKAISIGSGNNFSTFVNIYRVNKVKSMLNENLQAKFTMEYIYKSAGFRHQATFNRIFKSIVGITPMQFVKMQGQNIQAN